MERRPDGGDGVIRIRYRHRDSSLTARVNEILQAAGCALQVWWSVLGVRCERIGAELSKLESLSGTLSMVPCSRWTDGQMGFWRLDFEGWCCSVFEFFSWRPL
jgi:hypothetical protein